MKKIFLALTLVLALASCKKEKAEPSAPPPVVKKLVEEKNITKPINDRTYSYDNQGRLIKVDAVGYYWIYEHLSGKMLVKYYQESNDKLLNTYEYSLDASGRSTAVVGKDGDGNVSSNQSFEYDANGYMVKAKAVYANGEVHENYYTITGGNAVKQKYFQNGVLDDETDYEYDELVKCKLYFTMESARGTNGIHGKGYTNELKGFKRYGNTGALEGEFKATYVLDADGYVIKKTSFYPLTNQTIEVEFVYQ